MIPTQHHQQRRRRRRDQHQPILRKRVWPKIPPPLALVSYKVLLRLVHAVQDGQVEVGRGVVDRRVGAVGAEKGVRDKRGEGEREGGVAAWVGLELCAYSPSYQL